MSGAKDLMGKHKVGVIAIVVIFALTIVMAMQFLANGYRTAPGASDESFAMAVVDVQRLLNESKAATSIQKQLEAKRTAFQEEFSKEERGLREMEQKLTAMREKGDMEEFNKKKTEFEKELSETRNQVEEKRRILEKAALEAMADLRQEIVAIVANISDEEKFDIVVSRQNVVLAVKTLDITDEVMRKLNKKMPQINLDIEVN